MSDSQPLSEEKERYPCFLIKKDYFYMRFLFLIKNNEENYIFQAGYLLNCY